MTPSKNTRVLLVLLDKIDELRADLKRENFAHVLTKEALADSQHANAQLREHLERFKANDDVQYAQILSMRKELDKQLGYLAETERALDDARERLESIQRAVTEKKGCEA
jgi:hypothetical protein